MRIRDALLLVLLVGLAIGIWVAWGIRLGPLLTERVFGPKTLEGFGQHGDLFGGINALFSALAFAFLGWTAWMQSIELGLQRGALKTQQDEIQTNQKLTRLQVFETRLFSQIDIFRGVAAGLDVLGAMGDRATGADTWYTLGERARRCVQCANAKAEGSVDSFKEILFSNYKGEFDPTRLRAISPYLHTLYYVVNSVQTNSELSAVDRTGYVNIVRGILSGDEISLLALFGIVEPAFGIASFIEPYGLLKHLPDEEKKPFLEHCYSAGAFQGAGRRN